jgi:hypothetical protein
MGEGLRDSVTFPPPHIAVLDAWVATVAGTDLTYTVTESITLQLLASVAFKKYFVVTVGDTEIELPEPPGVHV